MKGNQGTARAINRRSVLQHLRSEPGLSRADLAGRIGLSRAAITAVVAEMIDEGLLVEGETSAGAAGRRPIPLTIDYTSRLAVGVRVTLRELECVLTDLSTEVLDVVREPLPSPDPADVVAAIAHAVARFEPMAEARGARITGVGIGLPGAVAAETGDVLRSFRLKWTDVPLARMLSARVHVPVWVDDDMHAYALTQQLFGTGRQHQTFGIVAMGEGIAAASIIDGRVRRGAYGVAGKLGHVIVDPDGPLCECGQHGCLQASWTLPALERRWQADHPQGDLFTAAADGAADDLLAEAGRRIGQQIATFCNVLDPAVLILGGEATALGDAFLGPLQASVQSPGLLRPFPVLVDWQAHSWARGAAALATQNLFDFEAVEGALGGHVPA